MVPQKPAAMKWARCSEYEIADGKIRPARGASVDFYDPWHDYRPQTTSHGQGGPHVELLRLVRKIEPPRSVPLVGPPTLGWLFDLDKRLRPEDEERILQWCRRWGLLGLWHQQTLQVNLGPKVREAPPWSTGENASVLSGYTSANGAWEEYEQLIPFPELEGHDKADWGMLIEDHWESDVTPAMIYRVGLTSPLYMERELESGDPQTHPLSEWFWRFHSEEVLDMWEAMTEIASAIENGAPETLLGTAKPTLVRAEGGVWTTAWACPSLIAMLGAMAFTDRIGGRAIRYCDHCGLPFVAEDPRQRYCAPPEPCKGTAKKRRQRASKPSKES